MGINTAGALLQIFGGGTEGTGKAMQKNAMLKMQEEALRLRESHIAKLRDANWERADARAEAREEKEYSRGLLDKRTERDEEREYSSPTETTSREIDALVSLGMTEEQAKSTVKNTLTAKGDKSLDKVKAYGTMVKDFIKVLTPEGMPVDAKITEQAHEKAVEAFRIFGMDVPNTEPTIETLIAELGAATKNPPADKPAAEQPPVATADIAPPAADEPIPEPTEKGPSMYESYVAGENKLNEGIDKGVAKFKENVKNPPPFDASKYGNYGGLLQKGQPPSPAPGEKKDFSPFAPESAMADTPEKGFSGVTGSWAEEAPAPGKETPAPVTEAPLLSPEGGLNPTWQKQLEHDVQIGGDKQNGIIIKVGDKPWMKPTSKQLAYVKKWMVDNPEKAKDIPIGRN